MEGLVDGRKRGDVGCHGEEEEEEGQEVVLVLVMKGCCVGLQGRVGFGRGCCRLGGRSSLCWGQSNGC